MFVADPYIGGPVGTFQEKYDLFVVPLFGDGDIALVPGWAYVVFFGLEPAGDLYVARLAEFFVFR